MNGTALDIVENVFAGLRISVKQALIGEQDEAFQYEKKSIYHLIE